MEGTRAIIADTAGDGDPGAALDRREREHLQDPGSPERAIQPGPGPPDPVCMFSSVVTGARVVGFSREGGWCQAPGCHHPLPEGAALVRHPDGTLRHFGPACARKVLGVGLTANDLLAIEARRHAAFVMDLAVVHAAFVAGDGARCAHLLAVLETLDPATVAERVVLESARHRLELACLPGA